MKEEIKIKRLELRNLLFWAVVGFTDSNGGTGENKLPEIVAKYAKECGFTRIHFPPMGIKSTAVLTGETKKKMLDALKKVYPRLKID